MELTCVKCNESVEVGIKDEYPSTVDLVVEGFRCEECRTKKEEVTS